MGITKLFVPANEGAMMYASPEEQLIDKGLFISNFAAQLRQTREGIVDLALSEDGNTVTILFDGGGTRKVNIACDSYVAIMRDILAAI